MDHKRFCDFLRKCGFDFYTGVPCSILNDIIRYLSITPGFTYISATKEDEAIGLAAGAYMGGKKPVVLMQNSGIGTCLNSLTSLALLYQFPILMIVSWRGHMGKDEPEHLLMGEYMLSFLEIMKVPTFILSSDKLEKQVEEAIRIMDSKKIPVALVVKKGVID